MKEDMNPWIQDHRTQGSRTDLDDTLLTLDEEGFDAMIQSHGSTYVKYHGGIDKIYMHRFKKRDPSTPPEVWWINRLYN